MGQPNDARWVCLVGSATRPPCTVTSDRIGIAVVGHDRCGWYVPASALRADRDRVEELRELSEAATEGPWAASEDPHAVLTYGDVPDEEDDELAFYVVDADLGINHPEDTALIIAAVNHVRSELARSATSEPGDRE